MFDYLIVGAGFAGSVLAERLASTGKMVMVVDRRPHIGGNAYDHHDDAGVLIHKYGPHIFHTNSQDVFSYLSLFTTWRFYEHRVLASVEGQMLPIPINLDTINRLYGTTFDQREGQAFLDRVRVPCLNPRNSEEAVIGAVGRDLYEKFFRGYTRKQWGMDPAELDASVCARIPTRTNQDDRYFTDRFQAMPLDGYTRLFENMLDHPNIRLCLNVDYQDVRAAKLARELIYTGPIDEYYGYQFGPLPYRSLRFVHRTFDQETLFPVGQLNFPNEHAFTRITEFKHLTGQTHPKTSIAEEYPEAAGDPFYPVPCPANRAIYQQYKTLADGNPSVHFVGRLATYRYYNMDQVIAAALALFTKLNNRPPVSH